tara:strand:- start:15 stop:263 length:249 start_codon:yes stop_codon:yes gene_type:complete
VDTAYGQEQSVTTGRVDPELTPDSINIEILGCPRLPHASVVTAGESCDNALVKTISGLFKTEMIHHRSHWQGLDAIDYTTLE